MVGYSLCMARVDNLSGSAFPFWGSKPLEVAGVRRIITSPADLPAPYVPLHADDAPTPASPWLTAAQRSSEGGVPGQLTTPYQQQTHAPLAPAPVHDTLGELQSLQSYVDAQTPRGSLSTPSATLQHALEEATSISATPLMGVAKLGQQPAPQGSTCRATPARQHVPKFASRRPALWLASKPAQKAALPACTPICAGASTPSAAGASKPATLKPQLAGRKRASCSIAQAAPRKRPAARNAAAAAKTVAPAGVQQAAPGDSSGTMIHIPGPVATSEASTVAVAKAAQAQTGATGAVTGAKPARKRAKAVDMDLTAVQAKARGAGGAAKLSVPEMQCLLRALKLPVSGKKAELLVRLEPHMAAAGGTAA